MADNNQASLQEAEPTSEILKKFYDFKKSLVDTEIKQIKETTDHCDGNVSQKEISYNKKKEHWEKSLLFYDEYLQIREEIAIKLKQSREELITLDTASSGNGGSTGTDEGPEGNINNAIIEDTTLNTNFNSTVISIKSLQQKLIAVVKAGQALGTAIKSCNEKDVKQLEKEISDFQEQVAYLNTGAAEARDESNENFEDTVKAAGIKALLNLTRIEELGKEIAKHVDNFVLNIDTSLTKASEEAGAKRDTLDQAIQALCEARDDCTVAKQLLDGYEYLKDFVDPDNSRSEPASIETLLTLAEKNFDFQFKLEKVE